MNIVNTQFLQSWILPMKLMCNSGAEERDKAKDEKLVKKIISLPNICIFVGIVAKYFPHRFLFTS